MDPLVLKMGGSLLESVPEIVRVIGIFPGAPILVVPGGGPFAERVREIGPPQDEAHWMAIAAMEQYGWFISSWGLQATDSLRVPASPRVFLPYRSMRERDPLPHTWDVTSDTIAAWVAYTLQVDLIVLKPVDGLYQEGELQDRIGKAFSCCEVDASFLPYVLSHRIRCTVLNGNSPRRLEDFLRGDPVRCTRVETTF